MYSINPRSISWDLVVSLPFLQSIQHIVPFAIIKSDSGTASSLDLISSSVVKMDRESVFDYETLVRLAQCISRQIMHMEKRRLTFIGFELSDIVSISMGKYFVVANYSRVVSFTDTSIYIKCPFVKPTFTSPEIMAITKLPATVSYTVAKYSLGSLIVSLIGGDVNVIKYTRLYWFLNRCLTNACLTNACLTNACLNHKVGFALV